jgi:predicted phosphodiesterase
VRYLVVSDIHGNRIALDAVLSAAEGQWDRLLCLGDIVGYGPEPNECVEVIAKLAHACVLGNHDLVSAGGEGLSQFNDLARIAAEWTFCELTEDNRYYLQSLPQVVEQGDITLVHGSPRSPVWEYLQEMHQLPDSFARVSTGLTLVGHTHLPRAFSFDPTQLVYSVGSGKWRTSIQLKGNLRWILNPGSVGQPRDGDPRAAFGLLDIDTGTFQFERAAYDIASTQASMRSLGFPLPLAERLTFGR